MIQEGKKDSLNSIAMKLIIHAGNARNLANEAFDLAKDRKFEDSVNKMKESNSEIVQAHNAQTEVIQAEAGGEEYEYSPLFAHAQDTLMTVSTEINMIYKFIEILKIMFKECN